MGRFRADAVRIRHINNLKIIFYNRETIYVYDGVRWHIFHRWFTPRGSYTGGWQQFRMYLTNKKGLTLRDCYHSAFVWDIGVHTTNREPDMSKFKVKEIFG